MIASMALPPKPDTPASPPASAAPMVPTERVYYPRPHWLRQITTEAGLTTVAQLERLIIELEYNEEGNKDETFFDVDYFYLDGQFTRYGSMELNEWQKLPPVPVS